MPSTAKVDNIKGATGNTVTIPTGQTFTITDGVPVASGGTGITSFTAGDLLYATGSTTLAKLGKGTTEQTLKMNTAASAPEYGTTDEIGGGTGQTSYTSGDFLYASGANTLAKLAKGSDDEILTLASGVPTWASAPAATGKVLQVIQTKWATTDTGTNYGPTLVAITDATCTMTPASTSNHIWFRAMVNASHPNYPCYMRIQKGGVDIPGALGTVTGSRTAITSMGGATEGAAGSGQEEEMQSTYISYLDSPSSTSALTYTITIAGRHAGAWCVNKSFTDTDVSGVGRSISTITLMEIDGT